MTWCGRSDIEHRTRLCRECKRVYQAHRRAVGSMRPAPVKVDTWTPSKLNLRISEKHARCREQGGCVPSGRYVTRPFPYGNVDLPVCKRCGVPIRGKGKVTQMTWMNTSGAA